ncbi:DUF523 domain-containing protein, partial [Methanocalculus sp.]|uniref:DUF523 domain-containing protein n=1 Tax=Methanocalculus sp. TaxID=2004547 RepID=UPI002722E6D5
MSRKSFGQVNFQEAGDYNTPDGEYADWDMVPLSVKRIFQRPTLVVSRCIEFDHVRYNGDMITSDIVASLKPFVTFIPVCPEVEIGLGIPRDTIRIVLKGDEE